MFLVHYLNSCVYMCVCANKPKALNKKMLYRINIYYHYANVVFTKYASMHQNKAKGTVWFRVPFFSEVQFDLGYPWSTTYT